MLVEEPEPVRAAPVQAALVRVQEPVRVALVEVPALAQVRQAAETHQLHVAKDRRRGLS